MYYNIYYLFIIIYLSNYYINLILYYNLSNDKPIMFSTHIKITHSNINFDTSTFKKYQLINNLLEKAGFVLKK